MQGHNVTYEDGTDGVMTPPDLARQDLLVLNFPLIRSIFYYFFKKYTEFQGDFK